MGLVGYSDSEESGNEDTTTDVSLLRQPTSKPTKPTFQKVIDRSNPHKIKVSLPEVRKEDKVHDVNDSEPPAKKIKTGAGAFSNFNSLLPAPKRAITTNRGPSTSGSNKGGLGSGINLRTGAAPGFSREPMPERETDEGKGSAGIKDKKDPIDTSLPNKEVTETQGLTEMSSIGTYKSALEPKKQGNPMMFKPLSVARKPKKKRPNIESVLATQEISSEEVLPQPKAMPKPSLFSFGHISETKAFVAGPVGEYQPLVYEKREIQSEESPETPWDSEPSFEDNHRSNSNSNSKPPANPPQSLDSIAADLNLSASAKRQLLGRQRHNNKSDPSTINIINFNTDQEYAANELLRQAGEQVQHNPVRAVAAGKHSLKQLVNAASSQKEALEEQFASGRRNKREAGSKYGW